MFAEVNNCRFFKGYIKSIFCDLKNSWFVSCWMMFEPGTRYLQLMKIQRSSENRTLKIIDGIIWERLLIAGVKQGRA